MTRWMMVLTMLAATAFGLQADDKETRRMFELRMYTAKEGKLPKIVELFEKTGVVLYAKYDIKAHGFFTSTDPKQPKFVALLSHADKKSRDENIAKVRGDETFKTAFAALNADGPIIEKAEEFFLNETDYTVAPAKSEGERVFELRSYTTTTGNLKHLDARFRDHTRKLFEKYGMTNLWYFHQTAASKDAANSLIYFMAHKSKEAHDQSFDKFRTDPEWIAARDASEKVGGGSLTAKDGVKSLMLQATSFSPLK